MKLHRLNILRYANITVILAGLCLMAFLSWQLADRVRDLQTAPVDNVQWNLSQLEVDFLKMRSAAKEVLRDGAAALPELRKGYDIFYSRVELIRDSHNAALVHTSPHLHHLHKTLLKFLAETVDTIDGPDADLVAAMPGLDRMMEPIAQATRGLAVGGIDISSKTADAKRFEISRLLMLIAVAAPVTFLALFLALAWQQSQKRELNRKTREIEAANRRFNSTLRASLDAIVVVNEEGLITDFNGSAEQVFGHRREDIIGKPIVTTLIPEEFREAHSTKFAQYIAGRKSSVVDAGRMELAALHADGHVFPIEISISETTGENGPNFVSYMRDITRQREDEAELKKARDDALEAVREKSKFFAMMSHEMRTPLNGIMSSLDLMKDSPLDKAQQRYVDIAETSSRILLGHVNDVLTIERLDSGEREAVPEEIGVTDLADTLLDSLRPLAGARNNTLLAEHEGPDVRAVGDLRGLQQILTNLLSNAIKFTSSGQVTLRTRAEPKGDLVALRFSVEDTGIGIAADNLDRIFEDFVTLESPYERTATGTGLGLGIVRRLVRGMGGTLTCDSAPRKGSTFRVEVTLPLAQARGTRPKARPQADAGRPGAELNILLVEDNEINRELLQAMIHREGHRVTTAANGFEGVHKASERHFDLILMDISMPNMNGIEATQMIRSSRSLSAQVPIYAVTAHAMPKELEEFTRAGMDGCLVKPVQAQKLRDVLAGVAAELGGPGAGGRDAPGAAPQPDLLNHAQIAELVSVVGREKAARLFDAFRADGERQMGEIRASAAAGDHAGLQGQVHKLSGSCGTFGAERLTRVLGRIETACKKGEVGGVPQMLETLEEVWRDTAENLEAAAP